MTSTRSSRTVHLRALLAGAEPAILMEAHDALSARIVEGAGLPAIWASGLSMSAAMGLRDCNEASVTQVLDVLELMADAVDLPILVDGDTGFGNFNNARRLVCKLEQRGLAGVVIEDKLFPKTNSFVGDGQPLADVDELTGKLAAMLDARTDPDFCVVARTEALVSGLGLDEALRRAEAYRRAGADAILIHSKRSNADEVLAFAARWERRAPLVAVPTTYVATPAARLHAAGINTVIYANQNLRAAIAAMSRACKQVRAGGAAALEADIAPLARVFELTRTPELMADEQHYLPATVVARGVVIVRAGVDAMAVRRVLATLGAAEVRPTTVVGGADSSALADVEHIASDGAAADARCLALAAHRLAGPVVVAVAGPHLADHAVPALRATPGELVALVDPSERDQPDHPWAVAARASGAVRTLAVQRPGRDTPCVGRFVGIVRASAAGADRLRALAERTAAGDHGDLLALLRQLAAAGSPVRLLLLAEAVVDAEIDAAAGEPGRQ